MFAQTAKLSSANNMLKIHYIPVAVFGFKIERRFALPY